MSSYKDKDGRWRYRFAFKGKRYGGSTPKGSNTKKAADHLERQHQEKLLANQYTGTMPTVSAFVDRFLAYQKARVKPLTYELQETQMRLHVVPHIGKRPLDGVGPLELDALVTAWKAAPRTVNARLDTLLRMFGLAVEWKILTAVPKVAKLKVPQDAPRFLSETEANALLEASKSNRLGTLDWHSMILVGLRTGLRVGELRGLQWADVDLNRSVVHVCRTDPGVPGMEPTTPKANKSRLVPLTPDALACLRDRLEAERERLGKRWSPGMWVWPGAESWRAERNRVRTRGEGNCKTAITRYAERAGLTDVGWHTLRHTFASWLVMRGVPLRAVQELLGHASIKMTERYSHLAPGFAHHAAVASLDVPLVQGTPAMLPPGNDDD